MIIFSFVAGLIIGAVIALFLLALCQAASQADETIEQSRLLDCSLHDGLLN